MSKPKPIRAHKRKPPKATKREATILEFDVWTSRSRGFPLKPDRRYWEIVRVYPPSPKTGGHWYMMSAYVSGGASAPAFTPGMKRHRNLDGGSGA